MYEIDEFGCWVLPQRDRDLSRDIYTGHFAISFVANKLSQYKHTNTTGLPSSAQKKFRTNYIMRRTRDTSTLKHTCAGTRQLRALVIWLYYLDFRIISDNYLVRVHKYHEELMETLGHSTNPFWEAFRRRDFRRRELLPLLRKDMDLRNKWHHDHLPVQNPFESWEDLVAHLRLVNDALEDALETFSNEQVGIY